MGLEIKENVPLSPLTTFKIGGSARWFVEVRNEDELAEAIQWSKTRNVRLVVLGGGSNVLVPDEGLDALIVRLIEGEHIFSGRVLRADAGCNLLGLIKTASAQDLGGWEKLSGIPGSIGGAVRGNAGAFGSEIKDFVTIVDALNCENLESQSFVNPYMSFSYRNSSFKQDPALIITSVAVELRPIKHVESERLVEETIAEREKRHLQNVQAAGSFFMNPVAPPEIVALFEGEKKMTSREGRVPAGWLIEKAGMKGATVGGAIASEQHPNYIVNTGAASASDVLALAEQIKLKISEKFGVDLREEAAVL